VFLGESIVLAQVPGMVLVMAGLVLVVVTGHASRPVPWRVRRAETASVAHGCRSTAADGSVWRTLGRAAVGEERSG
jgi:drug/metabolite transporter (DMT)-like permease